MKKHKAFDLSRLNVLIVDDNKHMCTMFKAILRAFKIRRLDAPTDRTAAMDLLRAKLVDLLICDWTGDSGEDLSLVRAVRDGAEGIDRFLPIILVTGHTDREHVLEARDAGINEILAKPISPAGLYGRIVRIVEHPRNFVEATNYVGPDRRHEHHPTQKAYEGEERRAKPETAAETQPAKGAELKQAELETLLVG